MLIALHKPYGVLSQFTPEAEGQRTLAEFELPKDVYPVGRLDRDSEGLLLLTDEKRRVGQLLDPINKVSKHYLAQVEGIPTSSQLEALRKGVTIRVNKRDYRTRPAQVRLAPKQDYAPRVPPIRVRKSVPDTWIELTITEGKNRQVRRMCAAVGLPVLRLMRVAVGEYVLGDLEAGQWTRL